MNNISSKTLVLELGGGITLIFRDVAHQPERFPSCKIQKGAVLVVGRTELVEEGLGFGVPIIKCGSKVVFPGRAQISTYQEGNECTVIVDYSMDLVHRMKILGRRIDNPMFYRLKESFSPAYRNCAAFRVLGTWTSSKLRQQNWVHTKFENIAPIGTVETKYVIRNNEDTIRISADFSKLNSPSITELVLANEQGASFFDRYSDSNGVKLVGKAIGIWDSISASEVSFVDDYNKIAYTLEKMNEVKMYRGWELVADRLAWSGFNYALPHDTRSFSYNINLRTMR